MTECLLRSLKVLLIEDSHADQDLIREMLAEAGGDSFEMDYATRLAEGIERVRAGEGVDVILLDLSLPDSRGLVTFARMHAEAPDVPIIVLSGLEDTALAVEAVREGAQDYLVKGDVSGNLLIRALRYAIERKQAERGLQRRNEELWILNAVAAAVNRSLDPKQILREALREVLQLSWLSAPTRGIAFLLDEATGELVPVAHRGFSEEHPYLAWPPRIGECLCGLAALQEQIVVAQSEEAEGTEEAEDAEERVHCRRWPDMPPHQEFCLPLRARNRLLGVLALELSASYPVSDNEIQLLTTIGDQISAAIDNARLYEEAQNRNKELAALNRMGQAIGSTLDLDTVLNMAMSEAQAMLEAEAASVLLYEAEEDQLVFAAAAGLGSKTIMGERMPATAGIAGWVLQQGQPILIHDAQDDPRFYQHIDALTRMTTHSLLAVPLVCKGKAIGVIEAVNRTATKFSEHDLELLKTLAVSAAIAIENAHLYQETARRLAEIGVLQEVMLAAASTLNFNEVLARALRAIRDTLGVEYLGLAYPDESGTRLIIHPSVMGFAPLPAEEVSLPLDESVCGRAYVTGQPQLISDTSRVSYYFARTPDLRSELAVPVWVEDRIVGVLNAESSRLEAFGENDVRLFQAIAAQLGVVMENARLYEAEREQRRLVEQSRTQLVQSEKLAATGRLAASLAHEINNPLQTIRNGLQLLLSFKMSPEENLQYLEMVDEEVQRLEDTVTRMLDFAKRPEQEKKLIDVNSVVEKVIALAGKYLQHRHVVLQRALSPNLPRVLANANGLAQVFLNLLLNAAEAMPEGGTLRIASHPTGNGQVAFSFSDTGRGVSPEHIDRVFEPFFSTKGEGTGLGLTISYNIVKRHDGEITVQSTLGEGTTFTVWLPALTNEQ